MKQSNNLAINTNFVDTKQIQAIIFQNCAVAFDFYNSEPQKQINIIQQHAQQKNIFDFQNYTQYLQNNPLACFELLCQLQQLQINYLQTQNNNLNITPKNIHKNEKTTINNFLKNTNLAAFIIDENGNYKNHTPNNNPFQNISELLPKNIISKTLLTIKKTIQQKINYKFEYSNSKKKTNNFFEFYFHYLDSKSIIFIINDISNLKQQKKEQQKINQLLQFTFEQAPLGIAILELNFNIIQANNQMCDILDYTPDTLIGKKFDEIIYPEDLINSELLFKMIVNQEINHFEIEKRFVKYNGDTIWTKLHVGLIADTFRKPIHLIAIIQDINKEKQKTQELNEKNYFIEKIMQAIPDYVYVSNIETKTIEYLNKDFYLDMGYNQAEYFKNYLINILHPNDVEKIKTVTQKLQNMKTNEYISTEYRIWNQKENKWEWILSKNSVFKTNEYGKNLQIFGVVQNITNLKITEQQLDEKITELSFKNNELQRYIAANLELETFAHIASHDLKEPIRNIIGFAQLLQINLQNQQDTAINDYINFIIKGTKRIEALINALREYAKIETSKTPYEFINTQEIIETALNNLSTQIQQSNTQIIYNPTNLPDIYCNPKQITIVFQNLILNAIKFRKPQTPPIITIQISKQTHLLHFVLADNGIGFENEYKEKIFTLFKRLNTNEFNESTGIGLSIAKKVINQHGGSIWAESQYNIGSQFHFTIPIINPANP